MGQVFSPVWNLVARLTIALAVIGVAVALTVSYAVFRSPYVTDEDVFVEQPIPFSHEHHVGGLGLDCRLCHTAVESSSFAGLPPTQTCMLCHRQIWDDAPMLAPVRTSWRTGRAIAWVRVHNLPDFVYFDHSAHLAAGVGCASCHGPVDRMPLMRRDAPLTMQWCLDCHRDPAPELRPRDAVFDLDWAPPEGDGVALGEALRKEYGVRVKTSCSVCHR